MVIVGQSTFRHHLVPPPPQWLILCPLGTPNTAYQYAVTIAVRQTNTIKRMWLKCCHTHFHVSPASLWAGRMNRCLRSHNDFLIYCSYSHTQLIVRRERQASMHFTAGIICLLCAFLFEENLWILNSARSEILAQKLEILKSREMKIERARSIPLALILHLPFLTKISINDECVSFRSI